IERKVEKIQRDIFQETRAGNFLGVSKAQKLLVKSLPARLLAVRQVTERNEGRYTPGVDGVTCINDADKIKLAEQLRNRDWDPDPVKLAWIPKPNGDMRKLGIPTMRDRAMQALVLLTMDPEWEAKFEPNSFGFRPGRSPIDAVHYIAQALMHYNGRMMHPGWVLDADITKCFDTIDHDALIAKIKGSPFQDLVRKWLKCGAINKVGFERTEKGTPQGGVISPLLANIALTGLESQFGAYSKTGRYLSPSQRNGLDKSVTVFRFADDFLVLAPSKEILESYVRPKVKNFLSTVGLELSEAKTRIVNVSEGFTFLGFTFQRFYRKDGTYKDFVYAPRRDRLDRFCARLKEILKRSLHVDVPTIIDDLNRRIRGFCNYFKWGNAYKAFSYLTHRIWELLWHWCKRRHPKRGSSWLVNLYWHRVGNDKWTFTSHGKDLLHPYKLAMQWWKWPKVRIHTSPYDPDEKEYWEARKKRSLAWSTL
nr:group II intron reverse transcriptase/maturase [Candidatus Sigynarchaeota archaeon]